MTTNGKQCLFPYKYSNETDPDLTYKICSTLDVYRPWCPTKLSETKEVLEWGDCLPDCPMEQVNSACLNDPEYPKLSDGTDLSVNFTTDFTSGKYKHYERKKISNSILFIIDILKIFFFSKHR